MRIAEVRVFPGHFDGRLLAFANVVLEDEDGYDQFKINSLRVVDGDDGPFVSMPQDYSERDDQYYDICHPLSRRGEGSLRYDIQDAVLDEYDADMANNRGRDRERRRGRNNREHSNRGRGHRRHNRNSRHNRGRRSQNGGQSRRGGGSRRNNGHHRQPSQEPQTYDSWQDVIGE